MTRKDFELIAEVLRINRSTGDDPDGRLQEKVDQVARDFASELRRTNPSFNRDRFLRAAGVEVGE